MSFSASIPPTPPEDFGTAVFKLEPNGQDTEAAKVLFDTAKRTLLALQAAIPTGDGDRYLCASISGHAYDGEAGLYPYNSCSISFSEVTAPTPTEERSPDVG
jgi:hypothetical protein